MPSNSQKIPVGLSLNLAMSRAAENREQLTPRCLPCSVVSVDGSIVTVKFEVKSDPLTLPQVQMPLFGPEYIRYPIQPGDKGFAISADAYLGQMSGLGDGTADLSVQPNLSTLSFMPCGNKNWRSVDQQSVVIYGPDGVILEDGNQICVLTLRPDGVTITLNNVVVFRVGSTGNVAITTAPSQPLTISSSNINLDSAGNMVVTGNVTWGATPTSATTHRHTGVLAGGATSGSPVPGT